MISIKTQQQISSICFSVVVTGDRIWRAPQHECKKSVLISNVWNISSPPYGIRHLFFSNSHVSITLKTQAWEVCLITESLLKPTTLFLLMIRSPGARAVLRGGGSYVGRVRARVWAPVTPAITNGSPSDPSSASPALQSKGIVSTHVKSRMEQEGHSGRRKEGGKGPAGHLHTPVILIYTGCQPQRSEFTSVAGETGLFSPSLAR